MSPSRTREARHAYYLANKEKIRAQRQRSYRQNRTKHLQQKILKKYGVTPERYQSLLAHQGGACAVCRTTDNGGKPLAVDHDHKTGAVRGLLCHNCNAGIGFFQDSPSALHAAAFYLGKF